MKKRTIVERAGWDAISAVRNDRIYEIKSTYILQPGPASLTEGLTPPPSDPVSSGALDQFEELHPRAGIGLKRAKHRTGQGERILLLHAPHRHAQMRRLA